MEQPRNQAPGNVPSSQILICKMLGAGTRNHGKAEPPESPKRISSILKGIFAKSQSGLWEIPSNPLLTILLYGAL